MADEPIAERVRRVYQKDLHDDSFSLNIRMDAADFDHGDMVRVTVEKVGDIDNRDTDSPESAD